MKQIELKPNGKGAVLTTKNYQGFDVVLYYMNHKEDVLNLRDKLNEFITQTYGEEPKKEEVI